jgi:hypothetical protein
VRRNTKKKEIIIVLLCLSAIAVSSGLLYHSLSKKSGGITTQIGTIVFKRKTAQRKLDSNSSWELLYKDSPVFNRDMIRTSDDSLSIIHFENGNELELDENTLVYIEIDEDNVTIDFLEGAVYIRNSTPGKPFIIKYGDTVVELEDAEASLIKNSDNTVTMAVRSGSGTITDRDGTETITRDDTVIISDSGFKIDRSQISLIEPPLNRFIISADTDITVNFTWQSTLTAPFVLHISSSRDFSDEKTVLCDTKSEKANFKPGSYYWKVSHRESDAMSIIGKFSVIQDAEPFLLLPENRSTVLSYSRNPVITFSWSSSAFPTSYTLNIYSDKALKDKVATKITDQKKATIDTLSFGTYYWNVTSMYNFSASDTNVSSNAGMFAIKKSDSVQLPDLLRPSNNDTFSSDFFKKNRLLFNWSRNADINEYELQISERLDFETLYYSGKTANTALYVEKHLPPGTYYWRLHYFDKAKDKYTYSDVRSFTVSSETAIEPISPGNRAVISSDKTIRIRWKDSSDWNYYRIELSKDHEFKDISESIVTRNNHADVHVAEGSYFWRISRLDDKGLPISTYTGGTFAVSGDSGDLSSTIVIVSPKNRSSIDMTNQSLLKISWKSDKDFDRYTVELLKDGISLIKKQTTRNNYTITELSKLDRGSFVIRISPSDTKEVSGSTESEFNILLQPLQKPGLITNEITISE